MSIHRGPPHLRPLREVAQVRTDLEQGWVSWSGAQTPARKGESAFFFLFRDSLAPLSSGERVKGLLSQKPAGDCALGPQRWTVTTKEINVISGFLSMSKTLGCYPFPSAQHSRNQSLPFASPGFFSQAQPLSQEKRAPMQPPGKFLSLLV